MAKFSCSQGRFTGKGNIEIFYQQWLSDRPKVNVVFSHGLFDHSGRYSSIINACEGKGVSFFAPDHQGYGLSKGERGHINSFMDYIYDLKIFVNMIRRKFPDVPLLMLGNGLGGAIACRYALTYQDDLSGLAFSSAGFIPKFDLPPIKGKCVSLLSALTPSLPIHFSIDPSELSHEETAAASFAEDPLVHTIITPRFYTEYMAGAAFCMDHARQLRLPLLFLHGAEDSFCDPKGSQIVYDSAESEDKSLFIFPGLYHDIMNESPKLRTKVLSSLTKWILSHSHVKSARKAGVSSPVKKKTAAKKGKTAKGKKVVTRKA